MYIIDLIKYRKLFSKSKDDLLIHRYTDVPTYFNGLVRTDMKLKEILKITNTRDLTYADLYGDRVGAIKLLYFIVDEDGYIVDEPSKYFKSILKNINALKRIYKKTLALNTANAVVVARNLKNIIDKTYTMLNTIHTMAVKRP